MEGYKITATVHDYNNPGQVDSQKIIGKLNIMYHTPEYLPIAKSKIFDNGLKRGVKITIFCWSLQGVNTHLNYLSTNITNLLTDYPIKGALPTIKINLTKTIGLEEQDK